MYKVSEEWNKYITQNSRRYEWSGLITLQDGTEMPFGRENIIKGSGTLSIKCCGSGSVEIGSVYASELAVTIIDQTTDRYTLPDAKVVLFYTLWEGNAKETIPMGIFEVSEANRDGNTLAIKGYDYMLRFDKPLLLNAAGGKAYDFLLLACQTCGVDFARSQAEIEALPNGKEQLGVYPENDMDSWRDLLAYVSQALGCFCVIDREGKLDLRRYTMETVAQIPAGRRFRSSFSDYITRYSSISSTNIRTNQTEYLSLEEDKFLTMDLGSNPFLQYGLNETRQMLLGNILNAVCGFAYVPFSCESMDNPALDVGDVLELTADGTQKSCVTAISYKLYGRQTLKGVGGNPKLTQAKTKNDKRISGLTNQNTENKTVYYNFMNPHAFDISTKSQRIITIQFTGNSDVTALFLGQILLAVTCSDSERTGTATDAAGNSLQLKWIEKEAATVTIEYAVDGNKLTDFIPCEKCSEGRRMINLFYPLGSVSKGALHTFDVWLQMDGGAGKIDPLGIRATLFGQGLAAADRWDGTIECSDEIRRLSLLEQIQIRQITDNCSLSWPDIQKNSLDETIARISYAGDLSIR